MTSLQLIVSLSVTSLLTLSRVWLTECSCNTAQVNGCRNAAVNDELDSLAGGGQCISKQYVQYTHLCTVTNYLPNVDYCCCKTDARVLCCRYHQDWYHFRCMETEDALDLAGGTDSDVTMIHWAVLIPAVLCPLMALAICLLCCCQKSASCCRPSSKQQSTRYYSSCSSSYATCCDFNERDEDVKAPRPCFSEDDNLPLSVDTHGQTALPPCDCTPQHKSCPTSPCSKCSSRYYPSYGLPSVNPFTQYVPDASTRDEHNVTNTYRLQPSAPPLVDNTQRPTDPGKPPIVLNPSAQSCDVVFSNSHSLDGDAVRCNGFNLNNACVGIRLPFRDVSLCDRHVANNDVIAANMSLPACQCTAQFCAAHMPALIGASDILSENATVFRNIRSDAQPMCVVCSGIQPPHYDSIDK